MSKRIIAILILCYMTGCLMAQDERLNIIFLLTDDQRWDALGYSGNDIIETPEMDKLAKEGAYFKNAFVTTPICAASRASIMTGLYERSHSYTFKQPPLMEKFIDNSYFSLLKKAGYYNGFLGKFGVRFENDLDTLLFNVYRPGDQEGYFRITKDHEGHQHLTDVIADQAIEFINEAPGDRPFCLSISYHAPHAADGTPDQYIWPEDLDALYEDVDFFAPELNGQKYFDALPQSVKDGFNRKRWKWRFDSEEKYQRMMKGYYRMITGVDRSIGRIRNVLMAEGLSENTVIILMGDNGYFLGERQLAGKWLMYEPSLRVPLIIYHPQGQQGIITQDMALNIDIPATILEIAKVKIPTSYHGKSLLNDVMGQPSEFEKRTAFLCEHLWNFKFIPPSEGIRTEDYKYFRYIDDPGSEEMYDLKNDPLEEFNLAQLETHRAILAELRHECNRLIQEVSQKD